MLGLKLIHVSKRGHWWHQTIIEPELAYSWFDLRDNLQWKFKLKHNFCIKTNFIWKCHLQNVIFSPWYFNSLWPSDVMWRHRSGSMLAQVMASCLTARSHYLNQCWLLTSEVLWHFPENNFTTSSKLLCCTMSMKIILFTLLPYLPGANELNQCWPYPLAPGLKIWLWNM